MRSRGRGSGQVCRDHAQTRARGGTTWHGTCTQQRRRATRECAARGGLMAAGGSADLAIARCTAPGFSAASRSLLRGRSSSLLRVRDDTSVAPARRKRRPARGPRGRREGGEQAGVVSAAMVPQSRAGPVLQRTWCRARSWRCAPCCGRRRRQSGPARRGPASPAAQTGPWTATACGPRRVCQRRPGASSRRASPARRAPRSAGKRCGLGGKARRAERRARGPACWARHALCRWRGCSGGGGARIDDGGLLRHSCSPSSSGKKLRHKEGNRSRHRVCLRSRFCVLQPPSFCT